MHFYHEAERKSLNPDSDHLWVKESWKFERTSYRTSKAAPTSAFKSSDVDIFLYGMTADEAERKIEHILAVLGNTVRSIIRGENCVTFVREWPHRNVQVILRLYRSKGEVLVGFDIDSCAAGFDGENVSGAQ